MADFRLGAGDDLYTEPDSDRNDWNHYFGEAGNDRIRFYQGQAIGGPGNDRIERLVYPGEPWRSAFAAYWDSPSGVIIDLAAGTAEDGFGTRDTLIGIDHVSGSSHADRLAGNDRDNSFNTQGGSDTFDGRGGTDSVTLWHPASDRFRPARLDEVEVRVSPDGLQATIRMLNGQFTITTTSVELIWTWDGVVQPNGNLNTVPNAIADFITPQSMAEQAIAAGGTMRWNASQPLGSAVTVSYSFVTQSSQPGFRAFSAAEQQLVRDILAKTAAITQLTFNEVSENGATVGQLRFGISQQASTKGQAFLPGINGDQAGDVWMDVESMAAITPGSEGYQALLHEIGHALGLRHPRNTDAGDAWSAQMREQDDRIALTVMSGGSSADGLFRADWGPLDVLALRHLYGTRQANAGNTMHTLGARESVAMNTLIDDGGTDTLDASALGAGVSLDLTPGRLASVGITPLGLAGVDNLGIDAGSWIEHAIGSSFDDVLLGNSLANQLTGGLGNDWIDGAGGSDTAVFSGRRIDYEISNSFGRLYVRARDGTSGYDTLQNIEQLRFADQLLLLAPKNLSADSTATVDEDASLSTRLPDPSDVARSAVSYRLVSGGDHGTATLSADGQLSYRPSPNYWGLDAITYEISGAGGANRYLSFVQVLPVNDGPPVSKGASLLVAGGVAMRGQLPAATDADGDPITYSIATDSRNGVVQVQPSGSFSYQGRAGFSGSDSFSFFVGDGSGGTNVYTVALNVAPVSGLVEGAAGADTLGARNTADGYYGFGGNDRFTGGPGNDVIDGGDGIDTAIYAGARNGFTLTRTGWGWSVRDRGDAEGEDQVTGVERLLFGSAGVALDLDGNAGMVAQILRGVFGKNYLANPTFVGLGLLYADLGLSYGELVKLAMGTDLFAQLAGGRSNDAVVNLLYRNVIGTAPSAADTAYFAGLIANGTFTQESLALVACQHPLNVQSVEIVGLASTGIEFVPA